MTTATDTDAPTPQENRLVRRQALRRAASRIRRAEQALEDAIRNRDELLVEYHGPKHKGGLSYEEMAKEVGVSRTRVIQITQGKSEYSKRYTRNREANRANGD